MAGYYELHCFGPLFTDVIALGEIPDFDDIDSWMSGSPLPAPVPEPVVIEIDPDEPGQPLELYHLEALIMSGRLLQALRSAGVDNLEAFRAELRGPESGRVVEDYYIVNVVGAVACADLALSEYEPAPGRQTISVAFDRLVIDESRTAGLKLFRLAESLSTLVVVEDVKQRLERAGFTMLTFRDVTTRAG